MKTKQLLFFLLSTMLCTNAFAGFVLQDPIITDSYMKFVGVNEANNYRYVLDTYEWSERGPRFQLTLEAIDASRQAQVTAADLADGNYWEPMFKGFTKELAGEEMEMKNNLKRLYVKNVILCENQFAAYEDLKYISLEADANYYVPDGCFSGCEKLDGIDCNVKGKFELGSNLVNPQIGFVINCSNQNEAMEWEHYKQTNNCNYTIVYESGVSTAPAILSITTSSTVDSNPLLQQLPDESGTVVGPGIYTPDGKPTELSDIKVFTLDSFTAKVTGGVTEVFMDYVVYAAGQGGQQHEWKQVYATKQADGSWKCTTQINVLEGLKSNAEYRLEMSFHTNPANNGGERAHFPTDGRTIRMVFTTGDLSGNSPVNRQDVNGDGSTDTQDVLAVYQFMQGASGSSEIGAEDVTGDGIVDTQDALSVYGYMQNGGEEPLPAYSVIGDWSGMRYDPEYDKPIADSDITLQVAQYGCYIHFSFRPDGTYTQMMPAWSEYREGTYTVEGNSIKFHMTNMQWLWEKGYFDEEGCFHPSGYLNPYDERVGNIAQDEHGNWLKDANGEYYRDPKLATYEEFAKAYPEEIDFSCTFRFDEKGHLFLEGEMVGFGLQLTYFRDVEPFVLPTIRPELR